MKKAETIEDVRASVAEAKAAGKTVGFVATLGGLHAGHFSLIAAARQGCDYVVVSIFLNPTQFAPGEDLDRYPRDAEGDLAACGDRGVDLVFTPSVETMYGDGALTEVTVRSLSDTLCGRSRPEHFPGVCTVVAKLFNIVTPDTAFFGDKDYQQAVVVKRMAADLNFPVTIVTCPIVREDDGLAMSTRNRYLSQDHRGQAAALHGALELAGEMIRRSHPPAAEVIEAVRRHLADAAPDGKIDYVQVVDTESLRDVEGTSGPVLVALAVAFAGARLIDNTVLDSATG